MSGSRTRWSFAASDCGDYRRYVVVVPCGVAPEGLPIGIQVVAGQGREDRALAVASVIEQSMGGFRRPTAV